VSSFVTGRAVSALRSIPIALREHSTITLAVNSDRLARAFERGARGEATLPQDFYAPRRPANLFADQQRTRALLQLLERERLFPLDEKQILDVGCGDGEQLLRLES